MLIAIRKRNAEFDEMCDLKTLKQWARTGEVHPNDLIKEDGQWVPASQASVLKGFFATAAWDVPEDVLWTPQLNQRVSTTKSNNSVIQNSDNKHDDKTLDDNSIDSLSNTSSTTSAQSDLKSANSKTSNESAEIVTEVDHFDHAAVEREYLRSKPQERVETPPITADKPSKEPETSIFPSKKNDKSIIKGTLNNESVRWNPEVDIKDQLGLLVDEIPPKSNFSWIRLTLLVAPGALVLFFIRAFVISEAQTVFPDSTNPSETVEQVLNDQNAPIPTNTQSATLYALESTLKSKLRSNAQNVTPEQSLSDALRVDLEYVGLDIVRIDARVLKWKGRLLNQPKSASISIVINSNGEVETEFILASLVVAKYSVRYYLEMPRFTIVIQDGDLALTKTISTEKAQFLYLQPGSLKDFIAALSESP